MGLGRGARLLVMLTMLLFVLLAVLLLVLLAVLLFVVLTARVYVIRTVLLFVVLAVLLLVVRKLRNVRPASARICPGCRLSGGVLPGAGVQLLRLRSASDDVPAGARFVRGPVGAVHDVSPDLYARGDVRVRLRVVWRMQRGLELRFLRGVRLWRLRRLRRRRHRRCRFDLCRAGAGLRVVQHRDNTPAGNRERTVAVSWRGSGRLPWAGQSEFQLPGAPRATGDRFADSRSVHLQGAKRQTVYQR